MAKKIFYIIIAFILFALGGFLFFLKATQKTETIINTPIAQTIIPKNSSKIKMDNEDYEKQIPNIDSRVFLELSSDEIFVDAISTDLNSDGIEDQIIAVKKLLDPFLYLIISIQNQETQKWERIHQIRTGITEPKSLNFNTIKLSNSLPAITYSGMTSDNQQTLAIQKIIKNNPIEIEEVVSLNAEIKIQVKKLNSDDDYVDFASFKIYAYDSDPEAPNTLNQIETEFVWNDSTNKYEKNTLRKISGKKIESRLLNKLKTGNTESIIEFLSGLWFKIAGSYSNENRSFYFDEKNKNIIFNLANIQEIYEISSIRPLRYGVFFSTRNKSIPNIIRTIRVEVKGVDEIQIRVIENVRRIKFGTGSLWSGIYKKNIDVQNTHQDQGKQAYQIIKEALSKSEKEWSNDENTKLIFYQNKYKLTMNEKLEEGFFNILNIKNMQILQLKDSNGEKKFHLIEIKEKDNKQILIMTRAFLRMNEIELKTDETITLAREI